MPNDFKSLADEVKPRERILADGNARLLSSDELLAVLLKTGTSGCDVMELARRLVSAFGSVHAMIRADLAEFRATLKRWNEQHPAKRVGGIGEAKTAELLAAFEFVRRGYEKSADALTCLEDAAAMFFDVIGEGERQEVFMVLPLDSQNRPLRRPEIVTKGLAGKTAADAREVFSRALKWGADSVIVAHNHPGGSEEPSKEDIAVTRALAAAGRTVGVELSDHLVLGDRPVFASLREMFGDDFAMKNCESDPVRRMRKD